MDDVTATPEDLERIQKSNQRRLMDFQAQGVAVNIPSAPAPLVELLLEAVVGPQGSPEWVAFIYAYELKVRALLDEIEPQVARARLMAPAAPNGIHLALRP